MAKVTKRKNRLAGLGYKIVISKHAAQQYSERAGVSMNEAQSTLRTKFKDSKLVRLLPNGVEVRKELSGSLNKRLTFIAEKTGHVLFVKTCYLQGPKDNFWKEGNSIIDNRKGKTNHGPR